MAKWKDIDKLSPKSEREREAAFEASMMAELAKEKKPPTPAPSDSISSPPSTAAFEGITIAITENGKTTTSPDLASVPLELRQRIVNAGLAKSTP